MFAYLPSLRLQFHDTYNDYRIVKGDVQFRPENGHWRTLHQEDIRMHFAFNTEVAAWLRKHSDSYAQFPLARFA